MDAKNLMQINQLPANQPATVGKNQQYLGTDQLGAQRPWKVKLKMSRVWTTTAGDIDQQKHCVVLLNALKKPSICLLSHGQGGPF